MFYSVDVLKKQQQKKQENINFSKYGEENLVVFLWILRNFQERLFKKIPPGDCLCTFIHFFH